MKLTWARTILSATLMIQTQISPAATEELTAGAQEGNAATTSVTELPAQITAPQNKKLSLLMILETSSNLYRENDDNYEGATELLLNPRYQLTENFSLAAKAIISKETQGARDTHLSNTSLSVGRKGLSLGSAAFLSHSMSVILPTNKTAQETDRLKGGVALSTKLNASFSKMTLEYLLALQRNFHEFNINTEGSPNIQYSLRHDLSLEFPLNSHFSLTPSGYYQTSWTYRDYSRNSYALALDLNYAANENLHFYVGTTNEIPAFKANGPDSNIAFFYNENTSVLRAGLSLTY